MARFETKITADTSQFFKAINSVVDGLEEIEKLANKTLNPEVNVDSSGFDEAKKKLDGLAESVTAKVNADDSEIDGAKKKIDQIDGSEADVNINANTDGLDSFISGLGGGLIGAGLLEGVGALVGGLGEAAEAGFELNRALGDLEAKTGASGQELADLGQAAERAFLDGVGESVAEATDIIAEAQVRLGDFLNPDELGAFTGQAQALANTFDLDVNEVLAKSEPLIKQFGLSGQEAFETLAGTLQNASTAQDDVLDTFAEYSQLAVEAGFNAQEFGQKLITAGEDGAFNLDKVADAIKEAQIRINAGDFSAPLDELSASADGAEKAVIDTVNSIAQQAQRGDISIKDALQLSGEAIQDAVNAGEISNSLASQLQVAIAGTPAEDLGTELYAKVFGASIPEDQINRTFQDAGDSISKAIGQYTSIESVGREFSLVFEQISAELISFADDFVAPILGGVVDTIKFLADNFELIAISLGAAGAAFVAYTAVTQAAAIAQKAAAIATRILNAAMAANPAGAVAAAIGLLVAAGFALADAFSESTEEQLESNKAEQEALKTKQDLLEKEKEQVQSNRDLIAEYERNGERIDELRAKENLTAREKQELSKRTQDLERQTLKLNKAYPDAIDGSKSFAENLKSVKEETGLQNANLSELDDRTRDLITRFEELGEKENKTAEEKKELNNITKQLNKEFPEAAISADDFSGSLSRVKEAAGLTFGELDKINGSLTKLGKQQKELQNKEINLQFRLNQEEIDEQIDEISTDLSFNLASGGLSRNELGIQKFIIGLKEDIQKTWDAEALDNKQFDLLLQLSDKLEESGADPQVRNKIQNSFKAFFDLQKQRIALNKETKELDESPIQEETPKKLDKVAKSAEKTTEKLKDLGNVFNKDFQNAVKDAFNLEPLQINLKLPDRDSLQVTDFTQALIDGTLQAEELDTAITGITFNQEQIDKIDEAILKLEEANQKIAELNEQETPQFFKALNQGQEEFIGNLSNLTNESDKVLKELEKEKSGLQKAFLGADSEQDKQRILTQINDLNSEIIQRTIETANITVESRKNLEDQYALFRANNEKEATEVAKSELNEQLKANQDFINNLKNQREGYIQDQKALQEEQANIQERLNARNLSENERRLNEELQQLAEKYNEELQLVGNNEQLKNDLIEAFYEDREDIAEEFADREAQLALEKFRESYGKIYDAIGDIDVSGVISNNEEIDKSLADLEKTYEEDTQALQEQLRNKEISQEEYYDRLRDLEEDYNEQSRELNDERIGFFETFGIAVSGILQGVAEQFRETFDDLAKDIVTFKGTTTQELELIGDALTVVGASVAAELGAALAEGELTFGKFIVAIIDGVQAAITALLAQLIMQKEIQNFIPGVGTAGALAIYGVATGLLQSAKALFGGAEEGVIGLSEGNKGKPGKTDTIPMMLAPGESVISAQATKGNEGILQAINSGVNWEDYALNSSLFDKYSNKELSLIFNNKLPKTRVERQSINGGNMRGVEQRLDRLEGAIRGQTKKIKADVRQVGKTTNKVDVNIRSKNYLY